MKILLSLMTILSVATCQNEGQCNENSGSLVGSITLPDGKTQDCCPLAEPKRSKWYAVSPFGECADGSATANWSDALARGQWVVGTSNDKHVPICIKFDRFTSYLLKNGCEPGGEHGGTWRRDEGNLGPCGDGCCEWFHKRVGPGPLGNRRFPTWFETTASNCDNVASRTINGPFIFHTPGAAPSNKNICVHNGESWEFHEATKRGCDFECCLYEPESS